MFALNIYCKNQAIFLLFMVYKDLSKAEMPYSNDL